MHTMQEWPGNPSWGEASPSAGEPPLWSHRCGWDELAVSFAVDSAARADLDLGTGWVNRWSAVWRFGGAEVACLLRDLAEIPAAGCEPVRRFSWRAGQRHRPGLQYLVSTGRHHGFESLEEARLLLVLDFAADLVDVVSQPFRLQFTTRDGPRAHTPDFLALTATGMWLVDVRTAGRTGKRICLGGPAAIAAEQLGTPLIASRYALRTVDEQLRTRRRRATFEAAVDALAHDLDTTPARTDFGQRRDALKSWSLSVEDWQDLIDSIAAPVVLWSGRIVCLQRRRIEPRDHEAVPRHVDVDCCRMNEISVFLSDVAAVHRAVKDIGIVLAYS
jgi:hypothetical protein